MIKYFPTPYEDEWWYSVLCRYYKSTGIKTSKTVKSLLFGNERTCMGSLFPNGSVIKVVEQLPPTLFDIDTILAKHTPLNYYLRFYSIDVREGIVDSLKGGERSRSHFIWGDAMKEGWKPRYCPCCIKEDPEPYYHLSHQIPIVNACIKHKCKLRELNIQFPDRELNNKFMDLKLQPLDDKVENATDSELLIAKLVNEHLTLPLSIGPKDYNNLMTGLINADYWKVNKLTGIDLDEDKLYQDMLNLYGSEVVKKVYGDKVDTRVISRMRYFNIRLADRYILLQGLIGMDTRQMFGMEIQDDLKAKFLKMANKLNMQTVKTIRQETGLEQRAIRNICKYYGIEQFWVDGRNKRGKDKEKIQISVDKSELEEIRAEAERLGFNNVGNYVIKCVRLVRKTNNEIHHQTKEAH